MLSTEGLQEEAAPPPRCSLLMEICWRTSLLPFEGCPLLVVLLINYANEGRGSAVTSENGGEEVGEGEVTRRPCWRLIGNPQV